MHVCTYGWGIDREVKVSSATYASCASWLCTTVAACTNRQQWQQLTEIITMAAVDSRSRNCGQEEILAGRGGSRKWCTERAVNGALSGRNGTKGRGRKREDGLTHIKGGPCGATVAGDVLRQWASAAAGVKWGTKRGGADVGWRGTFGQGVWDPAWIRILYSGGMAQGEGGVEAGQGSEGRAEGVYCALIGMSYKDGGSGSCPRESRVGSAATPAVVAPRCTRCAPHAQHSTRGRPSQVLPPIG